MKSKKADINESMVFSLLANKASVSFVARWAGVHRATLYTPIEQFAEIEF